MISSKPPPRMALDPTRLENAMARALELAKQAAARDEVPVGAVILSPTGEKMIAEAHNLRESERDPTGHAEILAIREAARTLKSWRLEDCVLVVTLEPCPMCLAACQQARLGKVFYAASDPKGGALSLGYLLHEDGKLNHRFEVRALPASQAESGRLLSDFFSKKRAKKRPAE